MEQGSGTITSSQPAGGQDAGFVRQAFASIARRYVLTNHVLSLGADVLWRSKTAREVAALRPGLVLDLATGSGDLAAEIQARCPHAMVIGADFSMPMLMEARKRGLPNLIVADATNLPFADDTADVVTVAFGLRNMSSWSRALREMSRVLRPHGTLFVLDFSLPVSQPMRGLHLFYLRHLMPRIAGVLTGQRGAYEYLCGSIEKFPSGAAMCRLMQENGFSSAQCTPLTFGIAALYAAVK